MRPETKPLQTLHTNDRLYVYSCAIVTVPHSPPPPARRQQSNPDPYGLIQDMHSPQCALERLPLHCLPIARMTGERCYSAASLLAAYLWISPAGHRVLSRTHASYPAETDGQDPRYAHERYVRRGIMSADWAHRCGTESADSADSDSGQVTRCEYGQTRSENRVAPALWCTSSRAGSARRVLVRPSRPLWVHRCVLSLLEDSAKTFIFLRHRARMSGGPFTCRQFPVGGGCLKARPTLPSGGPPCAYIHRARVECICMQERRASRRAVCYGC